MADRIVQLKDKNGDKVYPIAAGDMRLVLSRTDIGVGADLPADTLYGVYE